MGVQENVALVNRFYAAGPADNDSFRAEFAVPDVVWRVPGASAVSGRYEGYDEVFRVIGERMQPLDIWMIDVRHVMGNDAFVVAVVDLVALYRRSAGRASSRGPTTTSVVPAASTYASTCSR